MENNDIDKKLEALKNSNRKSGMIYTLIPLGIIFTLLMVFWSRLEQRENALDAKEKKMNLLEDSLKNVNADLAKETRNNSYLETVVAEKEIQAQELSDVLGEKEIKKLDTNSNVYQIAVQKTIADTAITSLRKNKSFDESSYIRYYIQKSDQGKVLSVLNKLELKYKKNYDTIPSQVKKNIGPINSIRYGSKVDAYSVQLLALELTKAGFELRAIEPLKNDKGQESNIVIYRNSYILDQPVFTAEKIVRKR